MALVVDVDNINLRLLADEPLLSEMWPVVSLTDNQMKEKYGRKVEDDEDDDKSIYCDVCKKSFKGSCNDHPLLWINNNKVSPCEDRAIKTLPSFLSVATSSIPKAGDGVFAKSDLPVGVVFGPYQGRILHNRRVADKTGYSWEIRKCGRRRRSEFVDGTDTKYANWLRYVNSARSESEQNLVAFQYVGFIWYKGFKPILDGEELLDCNRFNLKMASASVDKKNPLFIKGKCSDGCEAALTVGEEKTQLYVCMNYLSQLSDYFRAMFFGDFKEKREKEFKISDETSEDMISFFNSIQSDHDVQNITEESIELLMRLSDRFQCDLLKERLKQYIEVNEPKCHSSPTILNWLIWSVQYHMPEEIVKICLPGVACLPLSTLDENQENIGLELYAKLLDIKMQLKCKASELYKKKVPRCFRCSWCSGLFHTVPVDSMYSTMYSMYSSHSEYQSFVIRWCGANHTYFQCSNCFQKVANFNRCCEKYNLYYKCSHCQIDPHSYDNKGQCLCARKNYKIILNQMQ